jgi:molybdenum cofactor cytidylyltransferase
MAPPLTENPLPVAAIVLAAGQGSRMGGGKLLLPVGDASLIALTVRQLLAVPVADIVVVIGVYGLAVQQALQGLPVRFAVNPDPNSEMAESIRKGLALIDPKNIRAFLILPGDMPLVRPSTVRAVVQALLESDRTVAVPLFGNRKGHPVVFRADLYETVLTFRSPQGIRPLVHGENAQPLSVPVDDEGVVTDVDSWDDYRKVLWLWHARQSGARG